MVLFENGYEKWEEEAHLATLPIEERNRGRPLPKNKWSSKGSKKEGVKQGWTEDGIQAFNKWVEKIEEARSNANDNAKFDSYIEHLESYYNGRLGRKKRGGATLTTAPMQTGSSPVKPKRMRASTGCKKALAQRIRDVPLFERRDSFDINERAEI